MKKEFPVFLDEKLIGNVQLFKEGMFYNLSCRCELPNKAPYRLYIEQNRQQRPLGILVPEQAQYVLRMHIHAQMSDDVPARFYVRRCHLDTTEVVRLEPRISFPYLYKLENAYLRTNGNIYEIQFKDIC